MTKRLYIDHARALCLQVTVALSALSISGCNSDGGNPFASFDTRCAKLLPTRITVVQRPLGYTQDDSLTIYELTRKSGSAVEAYRTYGLTVGNFGHDTNTELRALEDRRTSRACGVPRIDIALSMQPVTVFIARELADRPCSHDATVEHELKHVSVLQDTLAEATARLNQELPATLGTGLRVSTSQAQLQQDFDSALRDYLSRFMREESALLAERQNAVDSPEEYARVAGACRGEVPVAPGATGDPQASALREAPLYSGDSARPIALAPPK